MHLLATMLLSLFLVADTAPFGWFISGRSRDVTLFQLYWIGQVSSACVRKSNISLLTAPILCLPLVLSPLLGDPDAAAQVWCHFCAAAHIMWLWYIHLTLGFRASTYRGFCCTVLTHSLEGHSYYYSVSDLRWLTQHTHCWGRVIPARFSCLELTTCDTAVTWVWWHHSAAFLVYDSWVVVLRQPWFYPITNDNWRSYWFLLLLGAKLFPLCHWLGAPPPPLYCCSYTVQVLVSCSA